MITADERLSATLSAIGFVGTAVGIYMRKIKRDTVSEVTTNASIAQAQKDIITLLEDVKAISGKTNELNDKMDKRVRFLEEHLWTHR